MQYEISLPADYDMDIIRHRVATRGPRTDAFGGLGLKAYGIREKGVNGSPVNQYAPFYLWATAAGMNDFLFGPGFAGLSNDFGRPAVRHWTGLAFERGPAFDDVPRAAVRSTMRLGQDSDVADAIQAAREPLEGYRHSEGVHSTALAVDPLSWEILQFTLWATTTTTTATDSPGAGSDEIGYEVLHLSRPEVLDLPQGRQWGRVRT